MEMGGGGSIMIFCNTKSSCSFVHEQLKLEGIDHGSCPLVAAVSTSMLSRMHQRHVLRRKESAGSTSRRPIRGRRRGSLVSAPQAG